MHWEGYRNFLIGAIVVGAVLMLGGATDDGSSCINGDCNQVVINGAILGGGALVILVLSVLARLALTRPCPRCGHRVENEAQWCSNCHLDFSTIGESLQRED